MLPMIFLIAVPLFFFLCLVPYHLYDSVQLSYFLHPFRQIDPTLWTRDWFVTQTPPPHPFFGNLIALFRLAHLLPEALFLMHLIQWALLIIGVFRLCRIFSEDLRIPLLVFSFILFYFSDGLGQSTLFSSIVQPTDLAVPIYLFSLTALFREKIILAWIFLGLSGLFHIHFGIDGLVVFLIFWLWRGRRWNLKEMGVGFSLFFLIWSPNLIPIAKNFSLFASSSGDEIFKVFFNFRSPHHYRPSTFELSHVFRVLFPVFFIFQGRHGPSRIFAATVLGLCLLATASIEWFYWPSIAKLFFFRLSPLLLLLGLVFLSLKLIQEIDTKKINGIFLTAVTFIILYLEKDSRLFIPFSLFLVLAWALKEKTPPPLFIPLILIFPFFSFWITGRGGGLVSNAVLSSLLILFLKFRPRRAGIMFLWSFIFLGIPAAFFHFLSPNRISFTLPQFTHSPKVEHQTELDEALEWIRNHTEKDALLLSPPYLAGVRFFSERAIVVDFHANPFEPQDLVEWKNRLKAVAGLSGFELETWKANSNSPDAQREFLREGYLKLTPSDLERIKNQYAVDYFLTESSFAGRRLLQAQEVPLVYSNPSYLVFRLKKVSA